MNDVDSNRPRPRATRRARAWSVAITAVAGACFLFQGCARPPALAEAVRSAAVDLALRHPEPSEIELYVDVSGSMRGFTLAATHNERGVGTPLASILRSLEQVAGGIGPYLLEKDSTALHSPQAGPHARLFLFGGQVRGPGPATLLSPFLGASGWSEAAAPRSPVPNPSRDCALPWVGSPVVRRQVDENFAEPITCLAPVFRRIADYQGADRIFVVMTDAEQLATPGGITCGAPSNFAEIQSSVASLLQEGRYFGMVVEAILPYHPWWSEEVAGSRHRYCTCKAKPLYLYVFSASPVLLNATWERLQSGFVRLASSPGGLIKTDLTPPPVSFSALKLTLLDGWSYFVEEQKGETWIDPPQGVLPVVRLAVEKELPTRVGLELTSLEFRSDDPALDDATLGWSVVHLAEVLGHTSPTVGGFAPADATPGASGLRRLRPVSTPDESLEIGLVEHEPVDASELGPDRVIEVEFHDSPGRIGLSKWKGEKRTLALEVRRRGQGHGEAVYLLQLEADRQGGPSEWRSGGAAGLSEANCSHDAALGDYLSLARPGAVVGRWILWVTWTS